MGAGEGEKERKVECNSAMRSKTNESFYTDSTLTRSHHYSSEEGCGRGLWLHLE